MPMSSDEKMAASNSKRSSIKIVLDSSTLVIFSSLGVRNLRIIPLVEVRLDSREMAMKIQKEFSGKKRSEQDFGKIFIANSVMLAMQLRVDILKAIAKQYSSGKESMSVSAFELRPAIHIRSKNGVLR